MKTSVRIFKALADPNRIRIFKMLQSRPLCVCEITAILGLATSTVSRHLSILRTAGMITDFKDSRWVNYRIEPEPAGPEIGKALDLMRAILEEDRTVQKDRKEADSVDRNRICGLDNPSSRSQRGGRQ
jgi:ArsR family transcriptional regulator, arsenate/arsenite/antimonite-responsive transcriptional repressor